MLLIKWPINCMEMFSSCVQWLPGAQGENISMQLISQLGKFSSFKVSPNTCNKNQAVLRTLVTESKQHHMHMWHHVISQGSAPYGHSKVVLPSGIVGTVLPNWDVSTEVLHYTESLLSVIRMKQRITLPGLPNTERHDFTQNFKYISVVFPRSVGRIRIGKSLQNTARNHYYSIQPE